MKGTIKFFDKRKGWGFITRKSDGLDYFVHYSSLNMLGFKALDQEDIVSFESSMDSNNRICAVNVKPILTRKMIGDSLKEENLFIQTIKDGYGVTKYQVVDQNNVIQTGEQGMSFLELAAYAGFDTEGLSA